MISCVEAGSDGGSDDTAAPELRAVHYFDRQGAWTLAILAAGLGLLCLHTSRVAWSDREPVVSVVVALIGLAFVLVAVRAPMCGLWIRGGRVQIRSLVQTSEAPIGDVIDARIERRAPGATPVLALQSGGRLRLIAVGRRDLSRQQAVAGSSWSRLLDDINDTIAVHQRSMREAPKPGEKR